MLRMSFRLADRCRSLLAEGAGEPGLSARRLYPLTILGYKIDGLIELTVLEMRISIHLTGESAHNEGLVKMGNQT